MKINDDIVLCDAGHPILECIHCGLKFETGVADPGPEGDARCPQCGLWETRPVVTVEDSEFVVRRTTRFR